MQNPLSQTEEQVVIGSSTAVTATILDTPEMLSALSSRLYKDGHYAAIREIMCNAWDSHIANKVDRPIRVILTKDDITIRDYGSGIPHDKIQKIFFTFGSSTKAADNKLTGRFGLGSKAPFAISDHFTLVNSYGGKSVTYALTRRNEDGRPSMHVMSSKTKSQTGVTIIIPISSDDYSVCYRYISHLCATSDLPCDFNNHAKLEKVQYSTDKVYTLTSAPFIQCPDSTKILIKYGAIVYPLNSNDGEVRRLINRVDTMRPVFNVIILHAPPGTLEVTPSRDSLSYSPETIAVILDLLSKTYDGLVAGLKDVIFENIASRTYELSLSEISADTAIRNIQGVRGLTGITTDGGKVVVTYRDILKEVARCMKEQHPKHVSAINKVLKVKLMGISDASNVSGNKPKKMTKAIYYRADRCIEHTKVRLLLRTVQSAGLLNRLSLIKRQSGRMTDVSDFATTDTKHINVENCLVLARTTAEASPMVKAVYGVGKGITYVPMVFSKGITTADANKLKEVADRLGVVLIIDPKIIKDVIVEKVLFTDASTGNYKRYRASFPQPSLVDAPNCYIEVTGSRKACGLTSNSSMYMSRVIDSIGKVAIAFNSNDVRICRKESVPSIAELIETKTIEEMKDPEILLRLCGMVLAQISSGWSNRNVKVLEQLVCGNPDHLVSLGIIPEIAIDPDKKKAPALELLSSIFAYDSSSLALPFIAELRLTKRRLIEKIKEAASKMFPGLPLSGSDASKLEVLTALSLTMGHNASFDDKSGQEYEALSVMFKALRAHYEAKQVQLEVAA